MKTPHPHGQQGTQGKHSMTSPYLKLPIRKESDIRLAQFQTALDRAAFFAGMLAELMERWPENAGKKAAAAEWRNVQRMLADDDDVLLHDHVRPALEMTEEVYGK